MRNAAAGLFGLGLAAAGLVPFGRAAQPVSAAAEAALLDCLTTSGVPVDGKGTDDWRQDVAPFNNRLAYKPVSIAVPATTEHIRDAVVCANKVGGIKVSAKCGGHSYASFGLGGEDGHLVLELDRMSKVTVDPKTNVASVQGGSRLGHVAAEIYAQGKRAISHGTCPG